MALNRHNLGNHEKVGMMVRLATIMVVITLFSTEANAGTAIKVSELASKSTVLVLAYDDNGEVDTFGNGVMLPNSSIATN